MRTLREFFYRIFARALAFREFLGSIGIQRPALLVIVRHGESLRNVIKDGDPYLPRKPGAEVLREISDPDTPLTARGHAQARHTGVALRERFGTFDVAYDSGYRRAHETLDGILAAYTSEERAKIKRRESHLIRERDSGYAATMYVEDVKKILPDYRNYWHVMGKFYPWPLGGESQAAVCDRVYQFIGMLFKQRARKRVLVVSHGHTIRAFRFNLEKWTARKYHENAVSQKIPNCGVFVYRYNYKTRRLELMESGTTYWDNKEGVTEKL
ncbi:MAG: histidine phosphatase family protein [Patescibacteria group bacterium]|nr:histidine phosphatase family protein [Patescibacteria group bacterium]MDE2438332.1 histidine phosphatase family protein [Patescibacteria group bacterium]